MTPVLAGRGITVKYGAVIANDAIDIETDRGEILGVIGPNGSGKSTLLKALSGSLRPSGGKVFFEGRDITGWGVAKIARAGVVVTSQDQVVFPAVTVGVALKMAEACHARTRKSQVVVDPIELFDLNPLLNQQTSALPAGDLRRVSVAMALAARPEILLLDEPAAGLNDQETREFSDVLRALQDRGMTVVIIDHDMSLMISACDRLAVIAGGRLLVEGSPKSVTTDPRVVEAYLGSPLGSRGSS